MQRIVVRHRGLLLVLAASVAASLIFVVAATASGERGVPFRAEGSLVTQSAIGPLAQCGSLPNVGYTSTYRGTATHLGRVTAGETVCLDFADFVYPDLPYTVSGTYQAANGDLLSYSASGLYNVETSAGTVGGFTLTGGTGRFLHAHGGGGGNLIVDASGNVVEFIQIGTLFYDASDRSG